MKVPFGGIARQLVNEREVLISLFSSIIDSGVLLAGRETQKLNHLLTRTLSSNFAILTNNGTSSLELIMKLLKSRGFSKVGLTPNAGGYASIASFNSGFEVYLIDCNESDALMNCSSLERAIAIDSIEVVIYTHLYGNLGDFQSVMDLCSSNDVVLVQDCAQSIGLQYKGRPVSSYSDFAALSFYPSKNLGALGDAGAILCKNKVDFDALKLLSQYGWMDKYQIEIGGGTNSRIDELQSAVIAYRISQLPLWNSKRKEILDRYKSVIHGSWGRFMTFQDSTAHLAVVASKDLDENLNRLRSFEIEFGRHYPIPDHKQKAWVSNFSSQKCPTSEELCESVLSLPCHPFMEDNEIDYICEVISKKVI
jgi:aminotransferase EvaB